jgi:phospholipid transport system substrate-binding protein
MANRGLDFLSSKTLSQDAKRKSFEGLLQDSFDLDTIARFSLGRYWNAASAQEKAEYTKLFRRMVVDVYSNRFSEYKGERFEVRDSRADSEKDAMVTSFIVPPDGQEIQVDWRVRYKNGKYQIVDVIVEGVSMSVTQRSEFSSIIQRGGGQVAVLIDHLKADPK